MRSDDVPLQKLLDESLRLHVKSPRWRMDIFLQTGHQSQCCRIVRFHDSSNYSVFPSEGFGSEASEVGPRSNKGGPCLVQLKDVRVTPSEFLSWFESSLLERYVTRIYWIDPGQGKTPAASEEDLLEILKSMDPPTGSVRLQCNPKRLERCLQDHLPLAWDLDPRSFSRVLSVVQCDGRLHWHLHAADSFYRNLHTHASEKSASSAIHKLNEALQIAGAPIDNLEIAIDLGAAPGGWTMLLARKVRQVLAVDNADLAQEALCLPNVVHIRSLAQNAVPHILRHTDGRPADLLVCDMNMHITSAIKPIASLLGLLRPGALLIVTLKYFGVGREPRKWEPVIEGELRDLGVVGCRFVWSLANTVNERTLIARKA